MQELQRANQNNGFSEMMQMAEIFKTSGMFPDIANAAMAVVKIQAGKELGIEPFAAMGGIHIIQGKATVGANLMASQVRATGKYDYKTITLTDTECSLDFYRGGERLGNSTFTIQDAKRANTKNLDKFPRNMLFARAMSNGVRWFCPDVFNQPVYVEGEIDNVTPFTPAPTVPTPPDAKGEKATPITLPPCSPGLLKKAIDKINAGEAGIVDKMAAAYSLTPEQVTSLTTAQAEFDVKNPPNAN